MLLEQWEVVGELRFKLSACIRCWMLKAAANLILEDPFHPGVTNADM